MNVGADFLPCLGGSKDPDDRHFSHDLAIFTIACAGQMGIKFSGCRLIVVNTVKPDTEAVHQNGNKDELKEPGPKSCMAIKASKNIGIRYSKEAF